jgi:hypothetical protein
MAAKSPKRSTTKPAARKAATRAERKPAVVGTITEQDAARIRKSAERARATYLRNGGKLLSDDEFLRAMKR